MQILTHDPLKLSPTCERQKRFSYRRYITISLMILLVNGTEKGKCTETFTHTINNNIYKPNMKEKKIINIILSKLKIK